MSECSSQSPIRYKQKGVLRNSFIVLYPILHAFLFGGVIDCAEAKSLLMSKNQNNMRHKLAIILAALLLVACGGAKRNKQQADERLAKIDVKQFCEYGLTHIESLDPFVVRSNEKLVLQDPETINKDLNSIRFEGWGEKEWLDNNYIRAVRLYLDAFNLGVVENADIEPQRANMKGKFLIYAIEPFLIGGADVRIVFVDNPSLLLSVWVYSFVEYDPVCISGYDVRGVTIRESVGLTSEEVAQYLIENPGVKLW